MIKKMLLDKGIDQNKYSNYFIYGTLARKEIIKYKLSPEDIESLPPKHNTRNNPDVN